MYNQQPPNLGFIGHSNQSYSPDQQNPYPPPVSPILSNYPPNSNTVPQQPLLNFQAMGDFHNSGPGYPQQGYPPQVSAGYQQPQVSPGYPPQQPQISPGYPPQQPQVTPGYPGQQISPVGQPAVCPTAPDLSGIQPVPGYEGLTFEQTTLIPPTVPDWQPGEHERQPVQNLPRFNEEEVRDAVTQFASEHCCYSSGPARDMQVREIHMSSAFHYKLETFTEKRQTSWTFEPYNGQPIDGPHNGPAPRPWDVPAVPSVSFVDSFAKIEVPHTAFTKPCHTCVGNGRIRCETCFGNGRKQCTWCKGRGRVHRFDKDEVCTSCNATGYDRCFKCSGSGQVKCKTCDARGTLKGYVELIVTWANHVDNYISEVKCMPKELILEVSGQNAYEEENPRVFPIVQGAEQAVCNASSDLIRKHGNAFTNERILKQRQSLRIIPVADVNFQWKSKTDRFCVYGFEHKVYFQEYPQKCCCVVS
ncbi:protein SSUH2 homolog [Parasteatoda tepidariorum]|uniref:protein SSUH2 homolog n=1 Tax=Parasteatoda tepidariorum TaxID=114398 RepID=UPI000A2C0173|nr:protein SSUH2 homolog [Parasteatoda tepidariorum]